MDDVSGARRGLRRMWSRHAGLLGILAGTAVLAAACGGGSAAPQVASLAHSSGSGAASPASNGGGNSAASGPDGNVDPAARRVGRVHAQPRRSRPGRPDRGRQQSDPYHPGVPGPRRDLRDERAGPLRRAWRALRNLPERCFQGAAGPGTPSGKTPDQATLDKFSACVRANGIPDFPDLNESSNHFSSNGGDLNPGNPALQNAMKLCGKKLGVQGLGGPSTTPGSVVQDFAGGGPGANG